MTGCLVLLCRGKVSGHEKGEDELKFEGYRKCYC